LTRRFGRGLDRDALHETRLQFHDETIATFAGLIAAECGSANPTHDLYGESLVNALFAKLFSVERPSEPRRRMPLSFRKLRSLTDYIDAHCLGRIRLADLAGLAGLSESATSHAFKAATGMPPHRWQMHARIRKVQEMILRDAGSLADIAEAAGFFDQAHLTRVFKSFIGLTPAARKKGVAPSARDISAT
jgi:AraC-like DNA-binding protein